mmetsp:Transcript_18821/g.59148  ORF Transcript_18821/g.59148 Transcript_18821/m.59148 type:complete len:127 (+) Transcript_18821:657-1037(+)
MAPMYYRGAAAAVIVFDLTKDAAWESVKVWHRDLIAYADPGVAISIAGNKKDMLPSTTSDFYYESCRATCALLGAPLHLTSARTGEGVDELFLAVTKRAVAVAAQQQHANARVLSAPSQQMSPACC